VKVASLKLDSLLSISESSTSSSPLNVLPVKLKGCKQCECDKSSSSQTNTTPSIQQQGLAVNTVRSVGTGMTNSVSIDGSNKSNPPLLFTDLLKKMFFENSYGRCTVSFTIERKSADISSGGYSTDFIAESPCTQFKRLEPTETPTSTYSQLSVSLASTASNTSNYTNSDSKGIYNTELEALLYVAGNSIGLLNIEIPSLPPIFIDSYNEGHDDMPDEAFHREGRSSQDTPDPFCISNKNRSINSSSGKSSTPSNQGFYSGGGVSSNSSSLSLSNRKQSKSSQNTFNDRLNSVDNVSRMLGPGIAFHQLSSPSLPQALSSSSKNTPIVNGRGLQSSGGRVLQPSDGRGPRQQQYQYDRSKDNEMRNYNDRASSGSNSSNSKGHSSVSNRQSLQIRSKTIGKSNSDSSSNRIPIRDKRSKRSIATEKKLLETLQDQIEGEKGSTVALKPVKHTDMRLLLKEPMPSPDWDHLQLDPDYIPPENNSTKSDPDTSSSREQCNTLIINSSSEVSDQLLIAASIFPTTNVYSATEDKTISFKTSTVPSSSADVETKIGVVDDDESISYSLENNITTNIKQRQKQKVSKIAKDNYSTSPSDLDTGKESKIEVAGLRRSRRKLSVPPSNSLPSLLSVEEDQITVKAEIATESYHTNATKSTVSDLLDLEEKSNLDWRESERERERERDSRIRDSGTSTPSTVADPQSPHDSVERERGGFHELESSFSVAFEENQSNYEIMPNDPYDGSLLFNCLGPEDSLALSHSPPSANPLRPKTRLTEFRPSAQKMTRSTSLLDRISTVMKPVLSLFTAVTSRETSRNFCSSTASTSAPIIKTLVASSSSHFERTDQSVLDSQENVSESETDYVGAISTGHKGAKECIECDLSIPRKETALNFLKSDDVQSVASASPYWKEIPIVTTPLVSSITEDTIPIPILPISAPHPIPMYVTVADLSCEDPLLAVLGSLSKLSQEVVSIILRCVVKRELFVLDAAIELCRIFRAKSVAFKSKQQSKDAKRSKNGIKEVKKTNKEGKKGKDTTGLSKGAVTAIKGAKERFSSQAQTVTKVLSKLINGRLANSLPIAQTVSSSCLLLMYLLLEMEMEIDQEDLLDEPCREAEGVQGAIVPPSPQTGIRESSRKSPKKSPKKSPRKSPKKRMMVEKTKGLLEKSFGRLVLSVWSPYLPYEEVQWLTLWDKTPKGKHVDSSVGKSGVNGYSISSTSASLSSLLTLPKLLPSSPNAEKRKSDSFVPMGGRDLKRQRSLKGEKVPPLMDTSLPRTKIDSINDIVSALQVRYQDLGSASEILKGFAASDTDTTPSKSPYKKIVTKGDALLALEGEGLDFVSEGNLPLDKKRTIATQKQPLIPLSAAGVALFHKRTKVDVLEALIPSAEGVAVANKAPDGKGKGKPVRNNTLLMERTRVGHRTGRGKGKSVRTSLKPDPNINSILSFTVPNNSSRSSSSSNGSSSSAAGAGFEKPTLRRSLSDGGASCKAAASDGSQSCRRSARKRAKDDGDCLLTHQIDYDTTEVADTPLDKIKARGKGNAFSSAMRALRESDRFRNGSTSATGTPDGLKGIGRGKVDSGNKIRRPEMGGGIAVLSNTVFGSGGRESRGRRMSLSRPLFLDPRGYENQREDADNKEGNSSQSLTQVGLGLGLGLELLTQESRQGTPVIESRQNKRSYIESPSPSWHHSEWPSRTRSGSKEESSPYVSTYAPCSFQPSPKISVRKRPLNFSPSPAPSSTICSAVKRSRTKMLN
jgi:hypothetical protein